MRSRQAFPSLDYTPPSRLPKGRSGGENRTMVKLLKRLKVGRGPVAMFRGDYVFDAVPPPSRLLFPSYRTGEETRLSEFRKLLDAVAVRAGWQRGEIRSKMFRHTYCAARLQTLDQGARSACSPSRKSRVTEAKPWYVACTATSAKCGTAPRRWSTGSRRSRINCRAGWRRSGAPFDTIFGTAGAGPRLRRVSHCPTTRASSSAG